jgi:hypothetical protein
MINAAKVEIYNKQITQLEAENAELKQNLEHYQILLNTYCENLEVHKATIESLNLKLADHQAQEHVVQKLIAVARAAYNVADTCEETITGEGRELTVYGSMFDDMSEALDLLDALPEDLQPNVVMTGPAKAEYMLLSTRQPTELVVLTDRAFIEGGIESVNRYCATTEKYKLESLNLRVARLVEFAETMRDGGDEEISVMASEALSSESDSQWMREKQAEALEEVQALFIKWYVCERQLRLVCESVPKREELTRLLIGASELRNPSPKES